MFQDKGLGAKVHGLVFRVWASGCGSWASGLAQACGLEFWLCGNVKTPT